MVPLPVSLFPLYTPKHTLAKISCISCMNFQGVWILGIYIFLFLTEHILSAMHSFLFLAIKSLRQSCRETPLMLTDEETEACQG